MGLDALDVRDGLVVFASTVAQMILSTGMEDTGDEWI